MNTNIECVRCFMPQEYNEGGECVRCFTLLTKCDRYSGLPIKTVYISLARERTMESNNSLDDEFLEKLCRLPEEQRQALIVVVDSMAKKNPTLRLVVSNPCAGSATEYRPIHR